MKITEIAFTAYSVSDMARARKFYEGVLGLTKTRDFGSPEGAETWVEYDIGPGCLALVVGGADWPPGSTGVAAALEVDDFEGYVEKARSAGATFVLQPFESPVCWMAVINDPDGNRIGIHRRKQQS